MIPSETHPEAGFFEAGPSDLYVYTNFLSSDKTMRPYIAHHDGKVWTDPKGSDGSHIVVQEAAHFSINAKGVITVSFDKVDVHCG